MQFMSANQGTCNAKVQPVNMAYETRIRIELGDRIGVLAVDLWEWRLLNLSIEAEWANRANDAWNDRACLLQARGYLQRELERVDGELAQMAWRQQ